MNNNISASKQTVVSLLLSGTVLLCAQQSFAQTPSKVLFRELKREASQTRKEGMGEKTKNIIERVKDAIKEKIKRQVKGTLTTIAGNMLSIQKDETTYTVTVSNATELKRRFGATSTLSEFKPNDELLVIGNRKKNPDGTLSATDIDATYIRNMSIQRRFAVFNGEVKNIEGTTIVLQTRSRGTQTVHVSNTTQYKEKSSSISFSDLSVGDNLIVKGELWDRVNDTIDAKTILRLTRKASTITPVAPTSPPAD